VGNDLDAIALTIATNFVLVKEMLNLLTNDIGRGRTLTNADFSILFIGVQPFG
jgi:hypothetical protein